MADHIVKLILKMKGNIAWYKPSGFELFLQLSNSETLERFLNFVEPPNAPSI